MTQLHDAFAHQLNRIGKALLRATGSKLGMTEASELRAAAHEIRDDTRKLIDEHKVASDTLALIALQPAPLTEQQRNAFAAMANAMRQTRGEAPQ